MKIYNYIEDLFKGKYKNEQEKLIFIKNVLDIFNPSYDKDMFDIIINNFGPMLGLIDEAEKACVNIVASNPDMFKIQIMSLADLKEQKIIKYYVKYYGDK